MALYVLRVIARIGSPVRVFLVRFHWRELTTPISATPAGASGSLERTTSPTEARRRYAHAWAGPAELFAALGDLPDFEGLVIESVGAGRTQRPSTPTPAASATTTSSSRAMPAALAWSSASRPTGGAVLSNDHQAGQRRGEGRRRQRGLQRQEAARRSRQLGARRRAR